MPGARLRRYPRALYEDLFHFATNQSLDDTLTSRVCFEYIIWSIFADAVGPGTRGQRTAAAGKNLSRTSASSFLDDKLERERERLVSYTFSYSNIGPSKERLGSWYASNESHACQVRNCVSADRWRARRRRLGAVEAPVGALGVQAMSATSSRR